MAVPTMTWGEACRDLQQRLKTAILAVPACTGTHDHPTVAIRVEAAHTEFISWCRDFDLDPRKTRLAFADHIRRYPQFRPWIDQVTDYIPARYNVRGVWTP